MYFCGFLQDIDDDIDVESNVPLADLQDEVTPPATMSPLTIDDGQEVLVEEGESVIKADEELQAQMLNG